jgi:putative hydrolase of the HAD superfamily
MGNIKNIIFDLGGVLINIDYDRTTNAFRDLGFPHFEKMYSQFMADQLFEKLETGKITGEAFYKVMLAVGNRGITATDLKTAWNSMLLDFRKESLDFLNTLKPSHTLFLLSNTNTIHLEAVNVILKAQTGLDSLESLFTKSYYSHLIGFRKPNRDVFDFVLEDAGLDPAETFFIDDSANNIDTAKKLGFKTHLLLPGEKIEGLAYSYS